MGRWQRERRSLLLSWSKTTQQSFVPGANAAMSKVLPALPCDNEIVFALVVVPPL